MVVCISLFAVNAQKMSYIDFYNKGKICLDNKQVDSATLLFNKSIELKSDFGSAYYQLGNVFFNKHEYHSSIVYYNKAIKLDNTFAVFYLMNGSALYELKKYSEAINNLNICIAKEPKNVNALIKKRCVIINKRCIKKLALY